MSANDGGSAFPVVDVGQGYNREGALEIMSDVTHGITLRDYFAAKAMASVIESYVFANNCEIGADHAPRNCASLAYKFADAMIQERTK